MESKKKKMPPTEQTNDTVEGVEKGEERPFCNHYTRRLSICQPLDEKYPIGIVERHCIRCGKLFLKYAGREYAWGECCSYTCHLRTVEEDRKPNTNSKAVVQLGRGGHRYFNTYPSALDAANAMGLKKADGIRDCCNGKKETSAGFAWMWASDYCFPKN